ncbi:MAG: hypothetical protein H7Z16_17400 [Pyrinomonadaceae bacterium]|nr:hypothetical protein [Pyrinomonadaceae bacterium]
MTQDIAKSRETDFSNSSTEASVTAAELDALRQRLAALEASVPGHASQTVARKQHWGATPKRLALTIAGVLLAGATIVFGQSALDSFFVSNDGNVGIGTSTPGNLLQLNSRVTPATTSQLRISANNGGSLSVLAHSPNNIALGFDVDYTNNSWLARDGSVAWLYKSGGKFLIQGSTGNSVGGAATPNTHLAVDLANGNVGIGTTNPAFSKLQVAGGVTTALRLDANAGVAAMSIGGTGELNVDAPGIVAGRFVVKDSGNVGIGTTAPQAKLDVAGNMRVGGTLSSQGRYQRDDSAETLYEVSPRYHLSLTAATYGGRTRQIPQQVINDLCGDQDGCAFRLGMTRWDNNTETETASQTALLYYSPADGRWRTNIGSGGDASGIDGNKATNHVSNAWGTCFFTDGPYSGYQEQGDSAIGMYLLVWLDYKGPSRTCELTLID